jgi:uncharacterized repeat protein (TIGR01451 family)
MGYARVHTAVVTSCARRWWSLTAVIFATAMLALLAASGSALAGTTTASTFTKTGTDPTTGSTATATSAVGTTAAGDTINWVLGYRNTTGAPALVNMTDLIGANQTFVHGSLQTPPGLLPAWSTNGGGSFTSTEPGSGVNAIRAAGTSVDGSTGAQSLFSPPLSSFSAGASQGDGWEALFIGPNIWNIHHHTFQQNSGGDTVVDCHVAATGAACPGYPALGQTVPTTAGTALGTAQPPAQTIVTAFHNNGATFNSRIYFPSAIAGTTNIGVSCVDTTNNTSCGYTQLGTSANATPAVASASAQMTGGAQIGSKYYTLGYSNGGPVYCFDMSTNLPCAGWTNPISAPGFTAGPYSASFTLDSWGGDIFTQQTDAPGGNTYLGCVVAATGALCPGWTTPKISGGNADSLAPITDASGTVTGICVSNTSGIAASYQCYNINGTPIAGAAPFSSVIPPGDSSGFNVTADPVLIGTRLYQPWVNSGGGTGPVGSSVYTCWDYSTNTACQGFTPVASGNPATQAYTLRQDPNAPDCIWELGNGGTFEVFSATFGGSIGCNEGNSAITLTPSQYYCDGRSGHVTGWKQLQVYGINSSQYDALAVTITDANGNPVPGWTNKVIPSSQVPIDISSIPYSGADTTLQVQVVVNWGQHPVVQGAAAAATFNGDPVQVCFQTKVGLASCNADQSITNDGNVVTSGSNNVTDSPNGNNTGDATFILAADPTTAGCSADLSITKSADSAAVTQGGQVLYTLLVKNHGPDTATSVKVSDAIPAGLSIVSAQPSQGTCSTAGAINCSLGTMLNGASAQILVKATVSSSATAPITNTATVSAFQTDPNPGNNSSSATVTPVPPPAPTPVDLVIVKHVDKKVVALGQALTYTIDVTNYGPGSAPNVQFTDAVAVGMHVLSVKPSTGSCTKVVPLTCNLGTIAAGNTVHVTVRGIPNALGTETNTVIAHPTCTGKTACPPVQRSPHGCKLGKKAHKCPDPHLISHATARVLRGLELRKTVSRHSLTTGGIATFFLTVTNPNPIALKHARVCDQMPSGLGYQGSQPAASRSHGQWCWNLGTLAAHHSRKVSIRGEALLSSSGKITNHATASAQGAPTRRAQAWVRVINNALACGSAVKASVARAASVGRSNPNPTARIAC